MRQKKALLLLLIILGICCLFMPHQVFAAETSPSSLMKVAPVIEELSLDPASRVDRSFTVANQGEEKLGVRVYIAPYSVVKETGNSDFETQSESTQIYHWIKIKSQESAYQDEAQFYVEPGKTRTINYRIEVPISAPGGSQHACIFVETIPDNTAVANGITTISRTALKVFAEVSGQTIKDANIISLNSTDDIVLGGKVFAKAKVENIGNVDIKPTLTLKVSTLGGETVFNNTTVAMIFPGNTSQIEIYWPETPMFGIYHLIAVVNILGKGEVIEKQIVILPVWFIILLLLVATAIVFIILYLRKRTKIKKAPKRAINS